MIKKHDKFVSSLAFNRKKLGVSANDICLASSSHDGKIHIYSATITDKGALLFEEEALKFAHVTTIVSGLTIESTVFTKTNELCVAARDVSSLRYYSTGDDGDFNNSCDVTVNGADKVYDKHCSFNVLNLEVSDDSKLLLAATDKDRNIVFQTGSPHIVRNLYGHKASAFSNPRASFTESGTVVGSSEDNQIFEWDLRDGKVLTATEDVHRGTIRGLTANGTMVATVSFDKSAKIWI